MYDHAIRRVGPTATLLEWDDRIPSFDEVHAEARKAEKFLPQSVEPVEALVKLTRIAAPDGGRPHASAHPPVTTCRATSKAADYMTPNDRLTSLERLEIYSRSYWYRILDSLYDDFPGLRAVIGDAPFTACRALIWPRIRRESFTLRNLGRALEAWLRRVRRYTGGRHALALDMVRLEWAHIEAFDGPAASRWVPKIYWNPGPSCAWVCSLTSGCSNCVTRWTICASGQPH